MAKPRDLISRLVAGIPAIIGVGVGVLSAIQPENIAKIGTFFSNPLNAGVTAVYATAVLAIVTAILFQLTLSSRTSDKQESRNELPRDVPMVDASESPPPTQEERASEQRDRHLSGIRITFSRTRRRMIDETERIQRNGFLNLMIGILFSVVALGILGYPLFIANATPAVDWINIVERFAPRMSVGILIQLIGFFFLRLYVAGESELHYIRNELTNFESRLISYHAAAVNNDNTALRDIIKQLVRTERNFKLKKGERALYSIDETYNDIGQLLKDALKVRRPKTSKT
jgi:hypothetical protein